VGAGIFGGAKKIVKKVSIFFTFALEKNNFELGKKKI